MGALSSQFEFMSTSDNIHSLDERQQQLQNDFSQFTPIFDSFSSHVYNMYPRPPPGALWCPICGNWCQRGREVMIQGGACEMKIQNSRGACCIYVLCFMLLSHYTTLNYVWIFFSFKTLSVEFLMVNRSNISLAAFIFYILLFLCASITKILGRSPPKLWYTMCVN
jgi:hypothetical protein